ncbi:hypothetical protein GCM10023166_18930 [Paeniglutamicibacter cryotolerans]
MLPALLGRDAAGTASERIAEVLDRVDFGDHVGFVLAPVEIHGPADADPLRPSDISGLRAGHPL